MRTVISEAIGQSDVALQSIQGVVWLYDKRSVKPCLQHNLEIVVKLPVDVPELLVCQRVTACGEEAFSVVGKFPLALIFLFDGRVDDKRNVEENVELQLSGERVTSHMAG